MRPRVCVLILSSVVFVIFGTWYVRTSWVGNHASASSQSIYTLQRFDPQCGVVASDNCRSAFQQAFAAIKTAGGGILQLPAGTFPISAPEVPQNVSGASPLASSSLIVVPPNTTIQGTVDSRGNYLSVIQWNNPSIPAFIFDSASHSTMKDLHIQYTGVMPALFPYGDIALLDALGYHPLFPHANLMSGGTYELFSFAFIFNSDYDTFDHLQFDSLTNDNNHIFGTGINLKGKDVLEGAANAGLSALAEGNRITNVQFADEDMGIVVSGQDNLLIQNIQSDWRGSTTAIAPGHLIYLTVQNHFIQVNSSTVNAVPMLSTNVTVENIEEGPDTLSNVNGGGTFAVKGLNGALLTNVTSSHPLGLLQSVYEDQNVVFSNMTWTSDYPRCVNIPTLCAYGIINPVASPAGAPPMENLTFENFKIISTGGPAQFGMVGTNITVKNFFVEVPPTFFPGQINTSAVFSISNIASATIENFVYQPVLPPTYDQSAKYNPPFQGWGNTTNASATIEVDWPSSVPLPVSYSNLLRSGYQYPDASNKVRYVQNVVMVPKITLTSPVVNASASGTMTVSADASDLSPVRSVQFFLDGLPFGSPMSAPPYVASWNASHASTGTHIWYALATDENGNMNSSTPVQVTVVRTQDVTPPTAIITSPVSSSSVSGESVPVTVSASDNIGVVKTELYVDGALQGTNTVSPFGFHWNTTSLANGAHSLMVKAYDAAGNSATSPLVLVTLSNPASFGSSFSFTNVSVSDVTAYSVRIAITLSDPASVVLRYGPTTAYGAITLASPILSTIFENLTGLMPGTPYDFMITATPQGSLSSVDSQNYVLVTNPVSNPPATASYGEGSAPAPSSQPSSPSAPRASSSSLPAASSSISSSGSGASLSTLAFGRTLSEGDTGPDVLLLQKTLGRLGYFPASVIPTEYFGMITAHALLLFQNEHQLNESGALDIQSQALMNKIVSTGALPLPVSLPSAAAGGESAGSTMPSGGGSLSGTENLMIGARGSAVTQLQSELIQDGDLAVGFATGYYGALTEAAVKAFQAKYGIINYGTPDTTGYGMVGPKTRAELRSLYP